MVEKKRRKRRSGEGVQKAVREATLFSERTDDAVVSTPHHTCVCAVCGRSFPVLASRIARTKYCSWACKSAAREKKVIQCCEYPPCPNIFTAKPSQKKRYCCKECFYDDRAIPIRPLPMGELERTQIEATILAYKPLVLSVARDLCLMFHPCQMDLDDFIQEGMIGLIDAIQHDFDEDKGDNFPGFAKVYIRNAIIYAYKTQEHTIRLPASLFRREAHVSSEQLEQFKKTSHCTSLEGLKPGVQIVRQYDSPVEAHVLKAERLDELYCALIKLPERQRHMIAEHYGLTCDATAMLQLCYKYKLERTTMHRLVHRGLDVLKAIMPKGDE